MENVCVPPIYSLYVYHRIQFFGNEYVFVRIMYICMCEYVLLRGLCFFHNNRIPDHSLFTFTTPTLILNRLIRKKVYHRKLVYL